MHAQRGLLCLLVFTAAVFVRPAGAQESTGEISGRVQNEVTGQYLNNARVSIKGTALETLTDESGTFHLSHVPSGSVILEALYSGLDPAQVTVQVAPGGVVERDIALTSVARYGASTVKLDPFVYTESKLTEGEALATNEQRFAANIKNVVATDAYGDVTEGNVAEFMKYLPGITVEYSDVMPQAVSVRGFDPAMTNVTSDGASLANASRNATTRQFDFMQVSINNISRIEVTKVPTPATTASGISGSVNMVTKSAFERSRAQLNYRVFVSASSDGMELRKQPFPYDTWEPRVNPGFDFDYTLPITKNFGIVWTGLSSKAWNEQNISQMNWNATAAGTGASEAHPFLQSHTIIDAPKWYYRNSTGLKADWRITPKSVLSVGVQATYYNDVNGNLNRTESVGTNATPTPATGAPMSYGDNFVHSATGRGTVTFGDNFLRIAARTLGTNINYRFSSGDWKIDSIFSASTSKTWLRFNEEGYFNTMAISLLNTAGVRVFFDDIRPERPGTIRAFDANNREIDLNDIHNFRLTTATAGTYRDHRADVFEEELHVRRNVTVLQVPTAFEVGGDFRSETRAHRRHSAVYTYNPVNPADPTPTPFLAQIYKNRQNYFDFDYIPWVSPNEAVTAWGKNPALFTQTTAQQVAQEQSRITGSENFKEIATAYYAETEARFFHNRLLLLTGVRYEKIHDKAAGPLFEPANVYVRTASGAFARDAQGNRIRRADAGAVGSMQELLLTRTELGKTVNGAYDGYYPSLHLTYNVTDKFLVRAAYAKTYGRPDYNNVIPNSTIAENDVGENADPSVLRGVITVNNPGLKPWKADNYDLSAEYYTDNGGVFSVGAYRKDISNFFNNIVKLATVQDLEELGLDPQYQNWEIHTTVNGGDARVDGAEFNVRQSLALLGRYGRYVSVFANATKMHLQGSQTAAFSRFIPESANWGFTVTRNPVTLMLKWNARGEQRQAASPTQGADAFLYQEKRTTLDANLTFQFNRRLSLFANGRNVFNVHYNLLRYGPQTPAYAKISSTNSYGVQWAFGVKGTF